MEFQKIIQQLEKTIFNRKLNYIEKFILDSSLRNKTYSQMTEESNYRDSYLREIGAGLWQELSQIIGGKVTKSNFILIIKNLLDFPDIPESTSIVAVPTKSKLNHFALSTDNRQQNYDYQKGENITNNFLAFNPPSMFSNDFKYIERPQIEKLAYEEIQKSDCLLRISASQKMGISFLTARILAKAKKLGYQTIVIDLEEADASKFISLDIFLYWFCSYAEQLRGELVEISEYWNDEIGCKITCRLYWEKFVISQSVRPLVIVIKNLHLVFEHSHIAGDFLSMLRHWHERAKQSHLWQRMRLIVTYTTEIYAALQLHSSPFNVGLSLKLPPFNLEETKLLASLYNLGWTEGSSDRLKNLYYLVGGHPYLLNIAFLCLSRQQISLSELLETAATSTGIYSSYLRKHLTTLQKQPQLINALKKLLTNQNDVAINDISAYTLQSMGLIILQGDQAKLSCPLYQKYFQHQLDLINKEVLSNFKEVKTVKATKELAESLLKNMDSLTLLPNKEYFLYYLESEWQSWIETSACTSLIICDLDYLNFYNQADGYSVGDICLRLVADKINNVVEDLVSMVSRYGTTQFAIALPNIELDIATTLGEIICQEIRDLKIPRNHSKVVQIPEKVITASIGVTTIYPSKQNAPIILLTAAQDCVSKSKSKGRNCITSMKYQSLKVVN